MSDPDYYDFASCVHVTFAAGDIVGDGMTQIWFSDWVDLPERFDASFNYLVAAEFTGGLPGVNTRAYPTTGFNTYFKTGAEAALLDKSNYAGYARTRIQVTAMILVRENPLSPWTTVFSFAPSGVDAGEWDGKTLVEVMTNTSLIATTGLQARLTIMMQALPEGETMRVYFGRATLVGEPPDWTEIPPIPVPEPPGPVPVPPEHYVGRSVNLAWKRQRRVKWERQVRSSHIRSIAFDEEAREMIVTWKNGSQYAFSNIAERQADEISKAKSPGAAIAQFRGSAKRVR